MKAASLSNLARSFYKTKKQTEKLIKVALFFLVWVCNTNGDMLKMFPPKAFKGTSQNFWEWSKLVYMNTCTVGK